LVVSEESADPGISGGTRPIPIEADHITICKPQTRQSVILISLLRHIRGVLEACVPCATGDSFAADDYAQLSGSDRRDLLQKLIAAGREHEYSKANDFQNKFAQRYYKLGLYTEAKNRRGAVLASVEQRFITHVFNAKICTGAPMRK
jgi:hypothetical protein